MSVNSSNCTFAFVNAACHANPGAKKKVESDLNITMPLLRKVSNTSSNIDVSI